HPASRGVFIRGGVRVRNKELSRCRGSVRAGRISAAAGVRYGPRRILVGRVDFHVLPPADAVQLRVIGVPLKVIEKELGGGGGVSFPAQPPSKNQKQSTGRPVVTVGHSFPFEQRSSTSNNTVMGSQGTLPGGRIVASDPKKRH